MKIVLTISLYLLCLWGSLAQVDPKKAYRIEGSDIVLYIGKDWSRDEQEKVLERSGMKSLSLDSLFRFGTIGHLSKDGWKLENLGNKGYKIFKAVTDLSGSVKWDKELIVFNELSEETRKQTTATFGFNSFRKQSVFKLKNGVARFYLAGKLHAHEAFLSGTFNTWSTLKTPMTKTDSGWIADVALHPGKHQYKFIVDGQWLVDPYNNRHEDNFHNDRNSVYFVTNHEFKLEGYKHASQVIVSGTFNSWNERDAVMKKTSSGWILPVYLKEGTYTYHFVVDRKTIVDPLAPPPSASKNKNSSMSLGDPVYFKLKGYPDAREVVLSGSFNRWKRELVMKKTSDGWQYPLVLPPGNYQYKFIIDGTWITDPANANYGSMGGETNSLIAVQPNHTFFLKGYNNARQVHIAGNFNNWTGYRMTRVSGGWEIKLFVAPGKCTYKFIVDGEWMIDPGNELWEQNEYGTGNSVMWIN